MLTGWLILSAHVLPPHLFLFLARASGSKQLFLSHSWNLDVVGRDNHSRVKRISTALTHRGFTVWLDETEMVGNIVEAMANGIDDSVLFVAFVTSAYIDKVNTRGGENNCKLEFRHAYATKGPSKMIVVVMKNAVLSARPWQGLLGAAVGSHPFVDLTSDTTSAFDKGIEYLERLASS